ncbi:MAG TPA: hypothetical protein VGG11_13720 [Xanthobacteraceae bacterium]|jgi:hypothetical protein
MDELIEMAQRNALLAARVALIGKLDTKEIDAVFVEAESLLKRSKLKINIDV